MLDAYYLRENPLPSDVGEVARLIRLRGNTAEVESVLREFFILTGDGWINERADHEINSMRQKQAALALKDAHETERMRRYRERRAVMFEELRAIEVVPAYDVPMKELQRLHDAHFNANSDEPATHLQRVHAVSRNAHATAIPIPTPTPTPTPVLKAQAIGRLVHPSAPDEKPACAFSAGNDKNIEPDRGKVEDDAPIATEGLICRTMRSMGYGDANPSDMKLKALVLAGLTADEVISVAEEHRGRGKGFRWVLAAAEGRRREAANIAPLPDIANPRDSPRRRMSASEASKLAAARAIFGTEIEGGQHGRIIEINADAVRAENLCGAGRELRHEVFESVENRAGIG